MSLFFDQAISALKLFDRMPLKLLTLRGVVHALGSLYLVGILTQLVLTSLSMFFVT